MAQAGKEDPLDEVEGEQREVGLRFRALWPALYDTQEAFATATGVLKREQVSMACNGGSLARTDKWISGVAKAAGVDLETASAYLRGTIDLNELLRRRKRGKGLGDSEGLKPPPAEALPAERIVEPPRGHFALENVLREMRWPDDVDVTAADLAIADARAEAYSDGGERPESLWLSRLLQLYRERTGRAKNVHRREPVSPPPDPDGPSAERLAQIAEREAKKAAKRKKR